MPYNKGINQKIINMYINRSRGFTLIELLVVIAIIGVLSSVVLASLNTARSKGSDASIKSQLSTIGVQGELFYDTNGKYSTDTTVLASAACPSSGNTMFYNDVTIRQAITGALSASGDVAANNSRCAIGVSGQSYAVAIKLKDATATGGWFCIDNTGARKVTGSATAPALAGNTVAAVCP
jgi:prepilin-type N-terminal cleavage/methylation domain-containing protein